MAASKKDYFGLSRLASIILAIIPITSWILGILTRAKDGHIVAAIIRVFFGFNILWICDIIFMVLDNHILKILNV